MQLRAAFNPVASYVAPEFLFVRMTSLADDASQPRNGATIDSCRARLSQRALSRDVFCVDNLLLGRIFLFPPRLLCGQGSPRASKGGGLRACRLERAVQSFGLPSQIAVVRL